MSFLEIKSSESNLKLDNFSFDIESNELTIKGGSTDSNIPLKISTPFSLSGQNDSLFDSENDIDQILLLRNNAFGEKNIIKVKSPHEGENKTCAFVFSLKGVLDDDFFSESYPEMIPYAVRSLVMLLQNKASLKAKIPEYRPDLEYDLFDFFEDDLIICAISKQQVNFTPEFQLSLLFHLNHYGFYFISDKNSDFRPEKSELQELCFRNILSADGSGSIIINLLDNVVLSEPYFSKYLLELTNQNQNHLIKFFLAYQCYEILIDHISKNEIINKICNQDADKIPNGYKLISTVREIGTESYRLKKLFKHYCNFEYDSDYHTSLSISKFLSKYQDYSPTTDEYGSMFYEFRNQLVHNLRLAFDGDEELVTEKEKDLVDIITQIEYMTIEVLLSVEL